MWEELKQGVKKMVNKKHELAECARRQRDEHIAELVKTVANRIRIDISDKLISFDADMRISTYGDMHVDISRMPFCSDISVKRHMGMINDRLQRELPDWIHIIRCTPIDSYTDNMFVLEYTINEDKL